MQTIAQKVSEFSANAARVIYNDLIEKAEESIFVAKSEGDYYTALLIPMVEKNNHIKTKYIANIIDHYYARQGFITEVFLASGDAGYSVKISWYGL